MEHPSRVQRKRRTLLLGIITLPAARQALAQAASPAPQPTRKLQKADVQYVDRSRAEGRDCDDCLHFVPGRAPDAAGTCRIVEGPISPHGHCAAFTAAPR